MSVIHTVAVANADFRPCVVIPCYNHGAAMPGVLARLAPFSLPCIIVDDGSEPATAQRLDRLAANHSGVTLVRLAKNSGKGQAVIAGFQAAAKAGFSHAIQLDADGQHRIEDIPRFVKEARLYPENLISGQPDYDDSVPKSRLYGRYVTHFWVWIETLSLSLKDSMCGFRVYPLASTLAVIERHPPGKRMDFDTEIMVRLYWSGVESRFLRTRVTYPPDGLSHFDALHDNLRISWMHARLFFGMLPRIPALLSRRRKAAHWAKVPERKGLMGMRMMLRIYQILGRGAFTLLLYPVVAWMWLTGGPQRRASQLWLARVRQQAKIRQIELPEGLNSYRHFLRFGDAMLNKIAAWRGDIKWGRDINFAPGSREVLQPQAGCGKLILAAHLGDIEASRALAQVDVGLVINALVFTDHARRFRQIVEEIAPQAAVNLLPVTHIGPETAMMLQDKIDAGEWVAIVGDRIAVNTQRGGDRRVCWSQFMGAPAPFPQGPFILAAALRCPIVLMMVLREQGKLLIHAESFADPLILPRATRQQALQQTIDRYAERLEAYALRSPLDWFNFYDFWQLPKDLESGC
ncbi:glycosyltransferase family 2 protein [Enterobacteriaceae bacterium H20N1]|uniref:Glycosyltransferase family 2 protein n=1 Tax=Dryocola boscaweniae TaxID=2925397 RepID=A0A9X2WAX9_9ENTR|nr:glycosyltransferase family 2 protein [Dryocola boscaweniae]MCT4704276.1 glycosyltransferase family 2 protein [Dryocola boscaweniae]MCT4721444.1 glycosyltransferase family 2 protein [Dryocola boscaweniae]